MEVAAFHPSALGRGLVSVALFVTSPCQGVTLHPALRSPDFPLCGRKNRRTAAAWPTPGRDFTPRGRKSMLSRCEDGCIFCCPTWKAHGIPRTTRSEERRVGKECRCRWSAYQ